MSTFVGIHLTPEKIEAACYEPGKTEPLSTYSLELPEGLINTEGEILNEKELTENISHFWKITGLRSRRVVLALWGKKVIVRLVQVPLIPDEHLFQTILSEAERYALFREENNLLIDYQIHRRDENLGIIYSVAPTPLVMSYKRVFQKARLDLFAVDTAQLSSQRGIAFYHTGEKETWTSAVLLTGKILITHWKQNSLNTWREVALMLYGDEQEIQNFDNLAENFTSEVVRTIGAETAIDTTDNALYVVSESHITSKALASHIEESPDIQMEIIGGLVSKSDEDSPLSNVSLIVLGVALWGYSDEKIPSLNLLHYQRPPLTEILYNFSTQFWEKQKAYTPLYMFGSISGLLLAALVIGGGYLWKQHMLSLASQRQREIEDFAAHISQMDSQSVVHTSGEIAQLQQFIQQETSERNRFAEQFVSQIHAIIPTDTWIDSLVITGEHALMIEGGSIDKQSTMNFMELVMKNFPDIRNITTLESQRKGLHYVFKIGVTY